MQNFDQKDMNQYTKIGLNRMTKMEVNTFEGIPIVKYPHVDDWISTMQSF